MVQGVDTLRNAGIPSRGNPGYAPAGGGARTDRVPPSKERGGTKTVPQDAAKAANGAGAAGHGEGFTKEGQVFSISVDESTGVMVVRIFDHKTGKVIKQIPAQEFIEADLSMEKIVGLVIDDQA